VLPELVENAVGQHLAGAVVPGRTQVVLGVLEPGGHGVDHLAGLIDHLGADPVTCDHRDARHLTPP
jgi:hypothetical protein